MSNAISELQTLASSVDYCSKLQAIWREILLERWVVGKTLFSRNAHHTSIPDASGKFFAGPYWACFSQTSAEFLLEHARALPPILGKANLLNHRYIFATVRGPALARREITEVFGPSIDFGVISLDEICGRPRMPGDVLAGFDVLCGDVRKSFSQAVDRQTLTQFRLSRATRPEASTMTQRLWNLTRDASILLEGLRQGLQFEHMLEIVDGNLVSLWLAGFRARHTGTDQDRRCLQLCDAHPPEARPYRVRHGDTLSEIVRRELEISYAEILPLLETFNPGLDPDVIRAGQTLNLPLLP